MTELKNNSQSSVKIRRPAIHDRLVRSYNLHAAAGGEYHLSKAPLQAANGVVNLSKLHIVNGKVILGFHVIHEPTFTRNTIGWSEIANGVRSIGNFVFNADGMVVSGKIHLEQIGRETENFVVFGTRSTTRFKTQYSKDGKTWMDGPDIELGVEFDSSIPEGQIVQNLANVKKIINVYGCPSNDGYSAVNYVDKGLASFGVDKETGNLVVNFGSNITFLPPSCKSGEFSFELPSGSLGKNGKIVESQDGGSFCGVVYSFDGATEYQIKGVSTTAEVSANLLNLLAARPNDYLNFQLKGSGNLTVQDLASQTLPNIQKFANDLQNDCLLYVMPDDLRKNLTGKAKPTILSKTTVDIITQKEPSKFLNQFYGPTYFGFGFANLADFGEKFTPDQKNQLKYTASHSLAKESSFSVINNTLFSQSAIMSSQRLEEYIEDKSTDWKTKLFDYLNQKDQIVQIQTEVLGANNTDTLNRYINLLAVFDPSGELPKKYYNAIIGAGLFSQMIFMMDVANKDNQENWQNILPQILQQIVNNWIVAPPDPTQGDLKKQELAIAIQEAAKQLGNIQKLADALIEAFSAGSLQPSFAQRIAEVYNYITGRPDAPNALKKLVGYLAPIGLVAGIYFTITGIANWSKLSTEDKVDVVAASMSISSQLISIIPEIVTGFVEGTQVGIGILEELYTRWLGNAPAFDGIIEIALEGIDVEDLVFNRDANANLAEIAENNFQAQEGRQLFSLGENFTKILKGVVVLAEVAIAGVQIYKFIKDITEGEPVTQTILDGIEAFSFGVVAVCDVIGLFVESALAACLGVVFAVIGVIVAIISLFMPQPKEKTPVEKYIESTIFPFIEEQKKKDPVPYRLNKSG